MMESQSPGTIVSGIEPVDELLGGLERGQIYLVHGQASGKSLFGIKFLIEGLKRGENGALVIRYSPEDAVRRFARLGYDCLEDVFSGRLVILEYSDDIIQKIGKLRELTPVLRELEWLLGETRPIRLTFDPVTSVLSGAEGNLDTRAREFTEWARSFGATVVLIANGSTQELIGSFSPLVAESFRFDFREAGDRAARFMSFEKSPGIPDQAIEVDPSRGVFLLGRSYEPEGGDPGRAAPSPPSAADLELIREELRAAHGQTHREAIEPLAGIAGETAHPVSDSLHADARQTREITRLEDIGSQFRQSRIRPESEDPSSMAELDLGFEEPFSVPAGQLAVGQFDELSDLLDDLTGSASPLDLDLPELQLFSSTPSGAEADSEGRSETAEQHGDQSHEAAPSIHGGTRERKLRGSADAPKPGPPRHGRASDLRIDSAVTSRAVELLLRPPEADVELAPLKAPPVRPGEALLPEPLGGPEVRARDFNVLIIEDDSETCDLVTQTLGDYSLEVVHDGVSGLAKLIAMKPDLVVLDFDLPIIDGFKVLTLIRSALNVPIVIISGSRMRAIDRVMASELGADYYLTKPFSAKELRNKARQLIGRYRGISSWILASPGPSRAQGGRVAEASRAVAVDERDLFTPYKQFGAEVEKRVKAAMENGAPFSIVGCRLIQMTANGGRMALRLFDIVRGLARESDLTSTNPRNDLVVLLADANTSGAQAFAGRLRERVIEELDQEPTLWMRSFPDLEESTETTPAADNPVQGERLNRRASDKARTV